MSIINISTFDKLFKNEDLTFTKIIYCKLNDIVLIIDSYIGILLTIYSNMDLATILLYGDNNITTENINIKGYKYYENIGISIRRTSAKITLKQIINIIRKTKQHIELNILLNNNDELNIKI